MMVVDVDTMDDGTLVITVSDMTGINRVNVREADTHYGDLYYRDGGFKEGYEAAQKTFELGKKEAQLNWIPVAKDMPEEKDTWFAKLWGTDKWSEFMFRRKSELVEVTVELANGTRYIDASRTYDGKWDVEEEHGDVKKKVVAWHYMSEPWEGRYLPASGRTQKTDCRYGRKRDEPNKS